MQVEQTLQNYIIYVDRKDEKIKYNDVTSLYPFVQKTGKYPFGTPTIITEVFDTNITNYFGLINLLILPPRKLRFPVLPAQINGKLLFVLCSICGQNKVKCEHSDNERLIEGTWVTEEVKLAVQHGYQVKKIFLVWHWDNVEQYIPNTKIGGLFTEYVNTFLKIKKENSGFPQWVKNDEDVNKYIADYE